MAPRETLQRLREQEREARRDLIVDAARRLFGAGTFDRTSMQEIAAEAGIAKSSIYTYFRNQEALFVETAFRDTNRLIDELEGKAAEAGGLDIAGVVRHCIDFCVGNDAYWRMITRFALYGKLSRESVRKLDVVARRLMDLVEGLFPPEKAGTDSRLSPHALFAGVVGILVAFRKYPGRTEEELVAHMKAVGDHLASLFDRASPGEP